MPDFPYTPFPFNVTPASLPFDLSPVASNISQGWVPSCSTPECVPTASWSTSSIGASLSFQFWGWDVAFDGNVRGNMNIELLRDGVKEKWSPSGDTLFRLHGQSTDQFYLHNITLRVLDASPDAELTVNQARVNGSSNADDYYSIHNWIVPSDDTRLSYMGFVEQANVTGAGSQTTYTSSKAGDTASMQFNGSALFIYGPCGPTGGLLKVKIDDRESTVNTSTAIPSNDCLLFQSRGLQHNMMHQLVVENVGGSTVGINRLEFFWLRLFDRGRSNTGEVVTVVAIVVIVLVLGCLGVFFMKYTKGGKVSKSFK
ncbi:unnamed protein product [Rhizoctonia solani]|uniref:Uncharacterized protein n=1 Tax=Rhizoctonia solani TaxID=456999 RepID=A0A8H2Y064_9AGAM|nr:unnamed protein product [Rhizoctonia solani]